MKALTKTIEIQTKEELDFIDITERIKNFIQEGEIENGIVGVQSFHTTAAIVVNENEPLLMEDFKNHLGQVAPKDKNYRHNDFSIRTVNMCPDECANGHAHCRALYLPTSVALNLAKGKLQLGQWQRIFLVELDRARKRKVQIQILGI